MPNASAIFHAACISIEHIRARLFINYFFAKFLFFFRTSLGLPFCPTYVSVVITANANDINEQLRMEPRSSFISLLTPQSSSQFSDRDSRLDTESARFSSKCKRNTPFGKDGENEKQKERKKERMRKRKRERKEEVCSKKNNLLTKLHSRFFQRLTLHNWRFPYNWIPSGAIASNSTDALYRRRGTARPAIANSESNFVAQIVRYSLA
ncbi:hypothetical protein PUN28_004142 [Cardiocondyla obscurior]|uniref:Uncharacterized protein n=1 Tax=Cardiocondyla obscurior TaxID=286306 RepID=A0AAW2GPR2_9HYME